MSPQSELPDIAQAGVHLPALELELRNHIPMTRAMKLTVSRFDERGLSLSAPLAPNVNPKHTAFAGSLYSLATLSGWGMVWLLTRTLQLDCDIVIQEGAVSYLKPITRDFNAVCPLPEVVEWIRFKTMLVRKGKARIALPASIQQGPDLALRFRGIYVAQAASRPMR
ncbi:MAG: YiiD C-terminal domain-containing protein [Acidiferrobacterales bacterium]